MARLQNAAAFLLLLCLVACQPKQAAESTEPVSAWASAQELQIEQAWARATPPAAKVGAAYVQIHNSSDRPSRLVGAESARASNIEVHNMSMQDGMMRMRRLDFLEIPAGQTVKLEPGGNHFMLFGLSEPLLAGQRLALNLKFAGGQQRRVEFLVRQNAPNS